MENESVSFNELKHIRSMMERSSRFISLSGLSGVAAGTCAIIGAVIAYPYVMGKKPMFLNMEKGFADINHGNPLYVLNTYLFWIAAATLAGAILTAFIFTYLRSRKNGTPIWGTQAIRLIVNLAIPLVAGGLFLIKLANYGTFGLIAPGCLLFYGLALLNASKYTLPEIRWLGIFQIVLAIINLFFPFGYGIYFWAIGFGLLHIVYGIVMWNKYERMDLNK